MMIKSILVVIMGALLLGWVIFCGIQFIRHGKRVIADGEFTGHVKCEKCGLEYDVSPEEFTRSSLVKTRSVSKTQFKGGAFVDRPRYRYFAKKFYCPGCGRMRYARVLNINELNDIMLVPSLKVGARWLAAMAIGGIIIIMIMKIPMYFADMHAEQQLEELRQEQYEDFEERYGL